MIYQPTEHTEYLRLDFDMLRLSLAAHRELIHSDGTQRQGKFCKGITLDGDISVRP